MNKLILLLSCLLLSHSSNAATRYLTGQMSNIASTKDGISIMLSNGVPEICTGTPYNWMKVKQEHTIMSSMVLAMWMGGKKKMTVYAHMENGHCFINQIDPIFDQ